MRTLPPVLLLATVMTVAAATDGPKTSLDYEIQKLDGKLLLEVEPEPRRLEIGDHASSGDRLRTKSSSQAVLFVRTHGTHFLLGPKTTCTLAHDRPGVLLHVERGRIRAIFDIFEGAEPRLVTTPSAVLAVRGTEYGLEVKKNGDTHLVVFAGVVEVADPAGLTPPVVVEAGHQTRIRHGKAPEAPSTHRLQPQDWDRGRTTAAGNERGFGSPLQGDATRPSGSGPGAGQGGSKRHGG